jgi:undecaprenyl-diphosphatase
MDFVGSARISRLSANPNTAIARSRSHHVRSEDRPPSRLIPLAAALGGVSVAVGLRLWLEVVGPLPGERSSGSAFAPWDQLPEPVGDIATLMSVIGHPVPALAIVSVSAWLIFRSFGRRDAAFVLLACSGVGANAVAKAISGPTPLWTAEHGRFGLANYPSGHVVFATVLGGALAVLAHRCGRFDLVGLALVLMVTMGVMRVISGAHLPSDVVAGYAFGVAWIAAAAIVVRAFTRVRPCGDETASGP